MSSADAVIHPPQPPRRGSARATTWWGKAWVRGLEETAYDDADLRRGRALSRAGALGGITVEAGSAVAAVEDHRGLWTASVSVPTLDEAGRAGLVEVVAAESGRIASLLAGDLPHSLVEHAEESGVELLPFGSELEASCSCAAWVDPCSHALALMYQLTWLIEADPLVLLTLRGLSRPELLGRLHARAEGVPDGSADQDVSVEAAVDAALRARRILELLYDPGSSTEHLF